MSQQREVEIDVKTKDAAALVEAAAAPVLTREQRKAHLVEVLDRGLTVDRLHVDLPPDVYGEWVPSDPSEIIRMQTLGFELDTKYASKRALHGSGGGESKVGDVVFMTTSRETHELIEEIRREKFIEMHGSPNRNKRAVQREEAEIQQGSPLPVVNESAASSVQGQEIAAQLFSPS